METVTSRRETWEVLSDEGGVFHASYKPTAAEAIADALATVREFNAEVEDLTREGRRHKLTKRRLVGIRRRVVTTVEIIEVGELATLSVSARA